MKKRLPIYTLFVTILALAVCSCNSDEDEIEFIESEYSNVGVNSFSLSANDSILAHLDTVFFAVDLERALIYNPDSLPRGTKLGKVVVEIGLPQVSVSTLIYKTKEGTDTVDYAKQSTDSVDFTYGPVILHLESADQKAKRDYTISINVHNVESDSLYWNKTASRALPTMFANIDAQKTWEMEGKFYCLTRSGHKYCLAYTESPDGDWSMAECDMPSKADPATLTASGNDLYVLDSTGKLYVSHDKSFKWSFTGAVMSHIYGSYEDKILGVRHDGDDTYTCVTYPESAEIAITSGCPVAGTSNPLVFTTEWSENPMLMVVGGRDASGKLTGDAWAFDGSTWANITKNGTTPREGVSVVPYFAYRGKEWITTKRSVLVAFGGRNASGECDNTVFLSYDRGIHWTRAMSLMQLPDYMPSMMYADVFVHTQTLHSRSVSGWMEYPSRPLPPYASVEMPLVGRASDTLITEWECPYIYVFGGYASNGTLLDKMWRGVINRLTFKPLQ